MPTSKTSLDFKLIAVRVLPGCVQHILKCLVENHFYYLNNDYRISEDAKLITRRSSNIAPLSASFFSLSEKQSKGVRLNFSAIVGMNGDGKSSLVELIIRILNNASIIHEIGEIGTLLWIQGVNAELYYHLDGIFYRLVTTEDDARIYRYVETGNVYKQDCIVGKEMLKKLFFYTMVSNYSLYAYNSLDIPNEWETKDNNQKDEENCWLHQVFHKNDGYQTPLSLHPYRSYGNIDMNREKFLSMQRLLSLMVHPRPTNPQHKSSLCHLISHCVLRPVPGREHHVSDYLLAGIEGFGYKDQIGLFPTHHDDSGWSGCSSNHGVYCGYYGEYGDCLSHTAGMLWGDWRVCCDA